MVLLTRQTHPSVTGAGTGLAQRMKAAAPAHSGHVIVVLIVALIVCHAGRVGVGPSGHQVVVAQLHFVMAREVTVVFCIIEKI